MTLNATTATLPSDAGFQPATRSLTSVLTPLERRTLDWLAHRMPAPITSDGLTALALLAMFVAGLSCWLAREDSSRLLFVPVCLAVNWFGDSLDGTLARVRQQQRPRYGFYINHIVDSVGAGFLLVGLSLSGHMSPVVALALLGSYLMLASEAFLATHTVGTFKMSHFKIGPTELRIIVAIGTLVLVVHPSAELFGRRYRLFDAGGVVAIVGMLFTFSVAAVSNAWALYLAEPIPAATKVQ